MDERTRICEALLAIVARAVYSDGVVEETERELVKRVVRALEVETARAKEILDSARREAPMRSSAGPADTAALWAEGKRLLAALPPGSGRRMLAARVGWALEVSDAEVAALVKTLAAPPAEPPQSTAAEALALAGRIETAGPEAGGDDALRMLELLNAGDLSVVAALAHSAACTGQLAALDPALTALVSAAPPAGPALATYQAALAGAAAGVIQGQDPAAGARLVEVVDLAERLAKVPPESAERWAAWAERAREAVRWLAPRRDWKNVRALEKRLSCAPRAVEGAVAPATAGALALWGAAALSARAPDELARARDRLARLAGRHDLAAVRREYAGLLAAVIASVTRDRFPADSEGPVAAGLLEALAQAHWEDRDLVLVFAAASADVQMTHVSARDDAGHRKLLARLSELAQRHPRDEELALHLARGLVQVGLARAGDLAPARREKDPTLVALRGVLDLLRESTPDSAALAECIERFDRQPGVPQTRLRAAPVTRASKARHPDLAALRDAFDRLQHGGHDAMPVLARILGVGPYLGRVMNEGEEAYQRDEPYFLDILEEIDRQIQNDRSGYWKAQMPKLDTMTRYMLKDATPAIAEAARALRARLNLPAR